MSASSGTMDSGDPVVDVLVQGQVPAGLEPRLIQVARRALGALGLCHIELSLVLCDDAIMAPLNAQWRGASGPTDVLSFPQNEAGDASRPSGPLSGPPRPLGDLVISVQTAQRQALELGHDLSTELSVLVV
ncbi:MAG: rRNA maturation RNase YbeY, partial [Oligoflexia bacterium]|nr:rRNA maturation RNase YbeY [Oligoflexia bacterium]